MTYLYIYQCPCFGSGSTSRQLVWQQNLLGLQCGDTVSPFWYHCAIYINPTIYCQLFSSMWHEHHLDFKCDLWVFCFLNFFFFEAKFYEPTILFESRSRTQLEDMCLFLVRHAASRLRYRLNKNFCNDRACSKFRTRKWVALPLELPIPGSTKPNLYNHNCIFLRIWHSPLGISFYYFGLFILRVLLIFIIPIFFCIKFIYFIKYYEYALK